MHVICIWYVTPILWLVDHGPSVPNHHQYSKAPDHSGMAATGQPSSRQGMYFYTIDISVLVILNLIMVGGPQKLAQPLVPPIWQSNRHKRPTKRAEGDEPSRQNKRQWR